MKFNTERIEIILYEYPSACPFVRIGSPPPPLPQASVCPPPPLGIKGREDNTRFLQVRGGGSKFGRLERQPGTLYTVLCSPKCGIRNVFSGIYSRMCSAESTPECVQRNLLQNVLNRIYSRMCSEESFSRMCLAESTPEYAQQNILQNVFSGINP